MIDNLILLDQDFQVLRDSSALIPQGIALAFVCLHMASTDATAVDMVDFVGMYANPRNCYRCMRDARMLAHEGGSKDFANACVCLQ